MKFSPTTFLGYVQALVVVVVMSRPLYLYWTVDSYDAVSGLAVATAITTAAFGLLAIPRGHFTADNPPNPKAND